MNLLYKAQTRFLFHAHIKIKLSAFYEDSIFDELFAVLEGVDKTYNSYQPDSYFDRINKNAGSFVDVDDETIRLLQEVIRLSEFFDGKYDITVMPLIRLWGFYKDEMKQIPSHSQIEEVRRLVDYTKIEIKGNQVKIAENQEIITGSFIKSYAVDRLVAKMQQLGVTDAIINAGGSTIKAINNESHPTWQVVARHPESEQLLFNVDIANQCYSTSSRSKTFVNIDGRRYGHILNPVTGFPSETKQVGIITDSCMMGDILSTALFNETADGFLEKSETLSGDYPFQGFMIDANDKMVFTQGFPHTL